jgi:hypothetical protein
MLLILVSSYPPSFHARTMQVVLGNAGIVPSNEDVYAAEHVAHVLQEAWGEAPLLSCHDGAIEEVWMCLSLELKPMRCPPRLHAGAECQATVKLPRGEEVSWGS